MLLYCGFTGSDEGVYAWVVANYALGTLGGDPLETTGIIELGGASAQMLLMTHGEKQLYQVLSEDLPATIAKISFPKTMRWNSQVANGAIDEATVRKGNEAVLRARYEDAKFFYELDTRKMFSEFREQLKNILFHEYLGTMLDKITRVENMVTKLSCLLDINEDTQQTIRKAASLAMSDLATSVVTEFITLMGCHYALRVGYSEQTAVALFEITLPRFSGDRVPKSDAVCRKISPVIPRNYKESSYPVSVLILRCHLTFHMGCECYVILVAVTVWVKGRLMVQVLVLMWLDAESDQLSIPNLEMKTMIKRFNGDLETKIS
ncbi:unnamed protein product [Trifolium pratense]|uniref:Uncharacterized protein n=1 Tax=Trifolium pratense TaxID=57577 RepID=A0ACB0M9L4_TRIPR|nr:unnamed protein product [Trifolium pratense]